MAARHPLGPLGDRGPGPAEGIAAVAVWVLVERALSGATQAGLVAHPFQASEYAVIAMRRLIEIAICALYWLGRGWRPSDLGLTGPAVARGLRVGVLWCAASGAVVGAVEALFRVAFRVSFVQLITGSPFRGDDLWVLLLAGGLVGPIFEEVLFRGFLYGGLRKRLGTPWAVAATALLFASAHTSFQGVQLVQATGGVLFALSYELTGSLWAPILVHVAGNLAIFLLPHLL